MITYQRPAYVRRSLPALIERCEEAGARLWLWHNGDHEETLEVVREHAEADVVARFHHSAENQRIQTPTNWLWTESNADLVGKVDDDCILESGWIERLAAAQAASPELGVVGCWRFPDEDVRPDLVVPRLRTLSGGHQILENLWVQGSGYLLERSCVERFGPMRGASTFTQYCKRLAARGRVNGWLHPFVREEHMDDPRSPLTMLHSDEDLRENLPLSAARLGIDTLEAWTDRMRQSALAAQSASLDASRFSTLGRVRRRLRRA